MLWRTLKKMTGCWVADTVDGKQTVERAFHCLCLLCVCLSCMSQYTCGLWRCCGMAHHSLFPVHVCGCVCVRVCPCVGCTQHCGLRHGLCRGRISSAGGWYEVLIWTLRTCGQYCTIYPVLGEHKRRLGLLCSSWEVSLTTFLVLLFVSCGFQHVCVCVCVCVCRCRCAPLLIRVLGLLHGGLCNLRTRSTPPPPPPPAGGLWPTVGYQRCWP